MIADQVRVCSRSSWLDRNAGPAVPLFFRSLGIFGSKLGGKKNQNGGVRMMREEGLAAASMASPMCQAPISRPRSISGIVV